MSAYEGRMLWPYAADLTLAEVDRRWPEAVVMMDTQLADMLDGRATRFVEIDGQLRFVAHDPIGPRRRWGIAATVPSSDMRWNPEHLVWIRFTKHTKRRP